MTAAEYRAIIAALGLTQASAAELLGVDARTSRRWALGETPIPQIVATVLRLLDRRVLTVSDMRKAK